MITDPPPPKGKKTARAVVLGVLTTLIGVVWKLIGEHFAAFLNLVVLLLLAPFALLNVSVTGTLLLLSLVLWYGVKKTSRFYRICKTAAIIIALCAFLFATLLPFLRKERYYLVTGLSQSPIASKVVRLQLSSGDAVTTVILRDPIRPRLAKYISRFLSPKSKLLEIKEIGGNKYVLLPLNGANEAVVDDKKAGAVNRSLRIPILISGTMLKFDFSEGRAQGQIFTGPSSLIDFTVTDRPDMVPWKAIKLTGDSDDQTCCYAAILNEAIETLTVGRTREGAEMIEELSRGGEGLKDARPPSSLEQARLYALDLALSRKLFRDLASCHAIPFLVCAYSALPNILKESSVDSSNLTARWIVSEILTSVQGIDAANLKSVVDLEKGTILTSDQTWTEKRSGLAKISPKFVEIIRNGINADQIEGLKRLTSDTEVEEAVSYFTNRDKDWDHRSWPELDIVARNSQRPTPELMYLPDYLDQRLLNEATDSDENNFSFKCDVIDRATSADPSGTSSVRAAVAKRMASATLQIYQLRRRFPNVTDQEMQNAFAAAPLTSSVLEAALKAANFPEPNDVSMLQFLSLVPPKVSYWDPSYRDWLCSLFVSHIEVVWPRKAEDSKYGAELRKQLQDGNLDSLIRDRAGEGTLSLPAIIIIEWMCRGLGLNDKADELERLCKDLTKHFSKGGLTARDMRRGRAVKITKLEAKVVQEPAIQKCIVLVGFSRLDLPGVTHCISLSALKDAETLTKDIDRVRDYANEQGFRDFKIVEVTSGQFERACPGTIRIVANEGPKYRFGSVSFSAPKSNLKELLDASSLKTGEPYSKNKVETAKKNIGGYYLSKAFACAEITASEANQAEEKVSVTFTIKPGPQIKVRRVLVEGNRGLTQSQLDQFKQKLPFREGDLLSKEPSDEDLADLALFHFDNGIELQDLRWRWQDTLVDDQRDVLVTLKQLVASDRRY